MCKWVCEETFVKSHKTCVKWFSCSLRAPSGLWWWNHVALLESLDADQLLHFQLLLLFYMQHQIGILYVVWEKACGCLQVWGGIWLDRASRLSSAINWTNFRHIPKYVVTLFDSGIRSDFFDFFDSLLLLKQRWRVGQDFELWYINCLEKLSKLDFSFCHHPCFAYVYLCFLFELL